MSWKASAAVKELRQDGQGKPLTPSEKCLLYTLADYYDEERRCAWPSVKRAANESMISERQASRIISDLQKRGILDVELRKNDTSIYRFKFGPYVKIEVEIPPEGGDNLSVPKELTPVTGDGHGPTKTRGGGDIAMSDKPPIASIEPERTNTRRNGSNGASGNASMPVLFSQEEMDKQDPVVRVWKYYHRVLKRGTAYTLTDRRRDKGRMIYKHALKTAGGNAENAAQLMKLAVDNLVASSWHVEKGFVSWEKNLFKSIEQFEEWIDPMEQEKRA